MGEEDGDSDLFSLLLMNLQFKIKRFFKRGVWSMESGSGGGRAFPPSLAPSCLQLKGARLAPCSPCPPSRTGDRSPATSWRTLSHLLELPWAHQAQAGAEGLQTCGPSPEPYWPFCPGWTGDRQPAACSWQPPTPGKRGGVPC